MLQCCKCAVAHARFAGVSPAAISEDALLDAAARAFTRHGYRHATLERIAAEASISRVTLHRRGITRDSLLEALVGRATEDLQRRMWPAAAGPGAGYERLRACLEELCAAAEDHMALLLALRSQSDAVFHAEEADDSGDLTRDVFTAPIAAALEAGVADGTLRQVDVAQTATLLFNLVGWTYVHMRTGHRWPPARASSSTIDVALRGLAMPQ